jgi:phage terminase small subunit
VKPQYTLFVAEYLKDPNHNATAAARAAGWSEKSAANQGSRLLKRLDIQGAIAQARASKSKKVETQVAKAENLADKVLSELSKLAFGNLQDCFDPTTGELLPINQLPREVAATLTAFENNKGFQKIKTGSKMGALELLAKITQILKQDQVSQQAVQIIVNPPPALQERQDTSQLRPEWE